MAALQGQKELFLLGISSGSQIMQLAGLVGNFAPLKGTRAFPREATQRQQFSHKAWKIPGEGQ